MSPQSGINDSNNNKNGRRTKPITVIPMAGAIVTAAALLLSGLSLITSYQPVMAQQQNITEGGGSGGGAATLVNTTRTSGGATQGGNTISAGEGGANHSASELRTNLEQARTALQNNDTQSAMMYLDIALGSMGGSGGGGSIQDNITSSTVGGGGNATTGAGEGVSLGGTSAADDYDETAD
jgi:hypothetical protein